MKRKLIYNVGVGALSVLMAASQITPAFAGSWQNSQKGWSYVGDDGKLAKGWVQTPSGWYYIDPNEGVMKTGWQQSEDGTWFFLSTANDGSQGSMLTGWCWIDGYCYYFNPEVGPYFGKMVTDATTPDGYQINADGKWVKDGQVVYEAGKGLTANTAQKEANKTAEKKSRGSSKSGGSGGSGGSSGKRSSGKQSAAKNENSVKKEEGNTNVLKPAEENKANTSDTFEKREESIKPENNAKIETPKPEDSAKAETPKPEESAKAETPKPEESAKAETPKAENSAKTEAPKPEDNAKAEAPKTEDNAKAESPKPEDSAKAEAPKTEDNAKAESPKPEDNVKPEAPKPEDSAKAEAPKPEDNAKAESPKTEDNVKPEAPKSEDNAKTEDNTKPNTQDENKDKATDDTVGKNTEKEAKVEDADKFAYVKYTKNIKIDFGEYVVVTFKYGNIDDYNVLVDGTDITGSMTKVDDDGHVVKWLSSVSKPSAVQIVRKSDGEIQDITLAGGSKKDIVKTDLQAPKYVISNGPITKFDYFLETYDEEGRVRKDASKTTFTLQKKKVDSKTLAVPTKYYIPITEIDENGQGNITIKLSLENDEQEKWFNGLNNIKLLSEESNILNSGLVYSTTIETKYGKTGVISIPLPQSNAYNRGDYYVSIGSANGNSRIRLPISLVTNTKFKVIRDSTTPNPKVGDDIRFKIQDPEGKHTFGNDVKLVMYKVTLTKPDGSVITLPKYDSWYNIGELLHISGKNAKTGELFTDVPGVYTATIYATGYKTMTKKFEVLSSDGTSVENTAVNDESKTVDAISSPTVTKTHSGNRKTSNEVLNGYSTGGAGTSKKTSDAVSSATKSKGSSADATSGASGSLMINSYLVYDYDLLANAMVLNQIGLRSEESDAVMKWWLEQTPEAIVGEDREKLYMLNNFVDAYNDARLEGQVLSFEDYIASSDAKTRNIVGNVKNVLENGKLGTIYRYGDIVGTAAPTFSGLTQQRGDSYTITTENSDFIEKLTSIYVDDVSGSLRNDSYLKQYEISADKKSITIYKNAFNEYLKPIVGTHKIILNAAGYEKLELQLTITDTLEEVELVNESEKLETGTDMIIKAINESDSKKGEFIKALQKLQIQTPEGELKEVYSKQAGGMYSDSTYDIKDGRITFGKGLFKSAGEYTIYLKAQGYPIKSIKFTLTEKAQEPATPPVVSTEDADAPNVKSAEKNRSFAYTRYIVKFDGMSEAELEKYLSAVEEVTVDGQNYAKASMFGFDDNLEFRAHANETFGGKKTELSIKGVFNKQKYEVVIKAAGYKTLSFVINGDGGVEKKNENPVTPPANALAKAPKIQQAQRKNSFLYNKYVFKFTDLSETEIEKYLKAVTEVNVNGVPYANAGAMGFSFGKASEFNVHSDEAYGGKKVQLSIKGTLAESQYDITIKATGYEDLSFELKADGTISEKTVSVPAPKVEIDGVEATQVNFADAYKITLKGEDSDISEFVSKLTEVKVNSVKVNKGTRISTLSGDIYLIDGKDIYVKSAKFKGLADEIVLKADGFDEVSFTTSSKMDTPQLVKSEVKDYYGKFVRASFDANNRVLLKNFMNEIKKGDITVTVNGETYNRTTAYRLNSAKTYKVSQNSAYGRDEYIDFSMDGFNEGENEVVISSDSFDTITFNVEVNAGTAASTLSGTSGFRSMAMVQRDLAIQGMRARAAVENGNAKLATSSNASK